MEKKCGSAAICFISFLPDILDSKAEGRNKYLEMLLSVAEKFKKQPYRYTKKDYNLCAVALSCSQLVLTVTISRERFRVLIEVLGLAVSTYVQASLFFMHIS